MLFSVCFLLFTIYLTGCASSNNSTLLGTISNTANPQVALYTVASPTDAIVTVEFGTDTNYGLQTWSRPVYAGGTVNIEVAGMRANTTYHMRARLDLPNGSQAYDLDQAFTTGGLPANLMPNFTTTTSAGMTPQPGVEMVNLLSQSAPVPVFATDLTGNVIWWYQFQGSSFDSIQPIKLLPNGNLIVVISPGSTTPISVPPPAGTVDAVREIDLAGNTIKEISIDALNATLSAAGYNLTVGVFHHDVLPLPNGHWIVLTNTVKQFTDLPGYPGVTNVLGDVLVDLDTNLKPVWVWNEFDHLDVNRQPFMFPDWTHTNAIIYSASDGNLIVSIRNQNLLVKVDYKDGNGAGNIIWKLGYQGNFTLKNGMDPTDWFYAQHGPSFATANTSGQFSLALFDNGDDRVFPPGVTCAQPAQSTCPYSTVQVLNIDETAMTATLAFHFPAFQYSGFGGNAEVLENGNMEFVQTDSTGLQNPSADVFEVTQESGAQTVWHLHVAAQFAYRAFRLPSLYPGVQW